MKKLFIYVNVVALKVEHHPKMTRYAAENFTLRQENRQLRSLESVLKAEEVMVSTAAELDDIFQKALESESKMTTTKLELKTWINCVVQGACRLYPGKMFFENVLCFLAPNFSIQSLKIVLKSLLNVF